MNAFYQELKRFAVSAGAADHPQPATFTRSIPSIWIGPQRASWLHRNSTPRGNTQAIGQAIDHESQAKAESQDRISPPRAINPSKPSQYSSRDRVISYQSIATSTYSAPNPSLATVDRIFHHKSNLDKILSRLKILSLQRDDVRPTSTPPPTRVSELSPPSVSVQSPLSPTVATNSTQTFTCPGIRARRSACSREGAAIVLEDALNDFLIIPRGAVGRYDSAATQYDVTSFIDGQTWLTFK